MEACPAKSSTSLPSSSTSSSSRTSSFSVEALISKPDIKTSTSSPGLNSSFSVERLLNRHSSKQDDIETKAESPASTERSDTKDNDETDFPWMHSTRYDPPPSKYMHCLFIYHI